MRETRSSGRRPVFDPRKARDEAESLAIAALAFLAEDAGRLGRFLESSGIEPLSLRASAASAEFLGGVLEHISSDERLLLDFAARAGIRPVEIDRARELLAGAGWERDTP